MTTLCGSQTSPGPYQDSSSEHNAKIAVARISLPANTLRDDYQARSIAMIQAHAWTEVPNAPTGEVLL
jgi:hypothetical protein